MKRRISPASAAAYVDGLEGWRRRHVQALRRAAIASATLEERIKWGHLVSLARGPVMLIRAEETRVLLGFWRGRRLVDIEPRLRPGGKYEMATLELNEDTTISPATVRRLTKRAVALNRTLGDPTSAARARR
jgi:hypothetical protein